jgi:hypothetical protein
MSHHFDTPTGREDPRLNLADFYLFAGSTPATTTMVMTVNPAANAGTAPFRDEAVYAFRCETDGVRREDVSFKVRFGDVVHISSSTSGLTHAQKLGVYRADHSPDGLDGDVLASGHTNEVVSGDSGVRVFAGVVKDAFAGFAAGLEAFKAAFAKGDSSLARSPTESTSSMTAASRRSPSRRQTSRSATPFA